MCKNKEKNQMKRTLMIWMNGIDLKNGSLEGEIFLKLNT